MDRPGSTTDYQSALSASSTPFFSDNVQDLRGLGTLPKNPSVIITVNSTADVVDDNDGVTTLREAINRANADNGEDLIVFDRSLFSTAQTITLTGGELDITHNLTIIAPRDSLTGGDLVTVSGNKSSRVFEIESEATVSLNGLIVADGKETDSGGGIKNSGTLTIDSCIIHNNSAIKVISATSSFPISGYGGGIYNNGGTVNVNNSTLSGNSAGKSGGGIQNTNTGTISVNNSTLSGNSAAGFSGGGISNSVYAGSSSIAGNVYAGTIEVSNSTVSGNSAFKGGGIENTGGIIKVSNSTLMNNSAMLDGGAIHNDFIAINTSITHISTVIVSNCHISGNSAYNGGGISNTASTMMIGNSTINGNSATSGGGGISASGTCTVNNSTISDNTAGYNGGGILISGNSTISNSTISNNTSRSQISGNQGSNFTVYGGGGIYNSGNMTVSNSTISGNTAFSNGGGIYNSYRSTLTLVFNTLTLNLAANGGGVFNVPSSLVSSQVLPAGSTNVRNTIIAANLNSENGVNPDVSGDFTSNGYNLIGDAAERPAPSGHRTGSTGFDAIGDIVGTSDFPIDPRLAPLDFYGGDTQTIALLPDSPAIDAGAPTVLDTDPTTDQRGFPRVSNGRSDIGAFEFST